MKKFFEEYGFVILASIVVILLIAMASPIGNIIKDNISHFINSSGDKVSNKLSQKEKYTISFNSNGGVLKEENILTMKSRDTFNTLFEGKHFSSTDDDEFLGYENYDFGSAITISTKLSFDDFKYAEYKGNPVQEWFGNWQNAGFGLGYDVQNDLFRLSVNNNGRYSIIGTKNIIKENETHWITGVYDADSKRIELYIDGVLQPVHFNQDTNILGPIKISEVPFGIGNNPSRDERWDIVQFKGDIYKAGLWTRAFTNDEIKDMVENDYINDAIININYESYIPKLEGKTFVGWYDKNGNKIKADTPVTRDMTLTAKWK